MPKAGYKVLTLASEVVDQLNELYQKNKAELRRQGIFSKQQFILFAVRKYIEDLERGSRESK
ncbi:MAG: hypothetical protein QXE57_05015 [Nitrososphaerales archaeon]